MKEKSFASDRVDFCKYFYSWFSIGSFNLEINSIVGLSKGIVLLSTPRYPDFTIHMYIRIINS